MSTTAWPVAHDGEQLERLILERERLRALGDPAASQYDSRIGALAVEHGLSEQELQEVAAHLLVERAPDGPVPLCGGYRISRPGRFIPLYLGAVLIAIVAALGAAWVALLVAAIVAGLYLFWPKKVARFAVDQAGDLRLDGEASAPLDWRAVSRIEVKRLAPRFGSGVTRASRERLAVEIEMHDGRRHSFARGMLFQISPARRPVHHVHLERYLRARAEQSGMSLTRSEQGFSGRRLDPRAPG